MYVCEENDKPLEEVDCFKYLGSQVAADGGCGAQNEWGYKALGVAEKCAKQ